MLEKFYPDFYMDSTYEINFEELYQKGYRGVIFDIDNTLVMHGEPADDRAIALFERLRRIGYDSCVVSNNKEPRVKQFAVGDEAHPGVGCKYIFRANKPSVKGYEKAMMMMNCDKNNTIFVGDQLFTDVWGANRTGMLTFLVKPIHPKEEIQIVIKRYLEKIVLHFYGKSLKKKEK